jgi:hypothetical protein
MFALPLLGVFSFEIARLCLAKQQLQNATDAGALAAAATLASSDNTDPTSAHTNSMQTGLQIFKQNFVLGQPLNNSIIVSSSGALACTVGQSKLFFEFINPITGAVEPISSQTAKVVRISSSSGCPLAFGRFLGINFFNVTALSNGAVPKLDLVLCFDVSGSMDDQTPVTCVERMWDPTIHGGSIVYGSVNGNNGPMQGTIFNILQPADTGSSLNGLQPQLLSESYWNAQTYFSEYLAAYYGVQGLRSLGGYPDQGKPPGNYPPGTAPTWAGYNAFTDLVVNIDGNTTFGGFSYNGYSFPNVATLVEAARGNLENSSVFTSSKANTSVSVSPKSGYQQAYLQAAAQVVQPMQDAQAAALLFTNILYTDADTHFGLVAFDSNVGSATGSTETWWNIDQDAPYGAQAGFPLPLVSLNPAVGANNYATENSSISSLVAMGSTNIGASLDAAVKNLQANGRTGSVKAIVLFTDGEPTLPSGPLDVSNPDNNARLAAVEANSAGIPIYTVGLAQNPAIVPGETAMLNDTNSNPSSGGIAAIAGHGGTFNLVTNSKLLRESFEKIARHLVQLIQPT